MSQEILASTIEKDYRIFLENDTKNIIVKNNDTNEDLSMSIDQKSVLSVIQKADELDDDWNITELVYYPSFNALYLKCVEYLSTPYCDGWNYKVNEIDSWDSVEQKILSKGDKVQLYFQPWGDPDVQLSFQIDVYAKSGRRAQQKAIIEEPQKIEINLEKLINFIETNIKNNDEYMPEMYVDWAIIGLASQDKERALKYLDFYKNKENTEYLTDNIRRSITLLSLGQNPYTFEGKNHIQKIIEKFDGEQFGEKTLINDDIFSLIVLQNVGYFYSDLEVQKSLNFILKIQNENGSISNSADMTSAYIQALKKFENEREEIKESLNKAKSYLESSQGQNGSWNDSVSSTAWVLQALSLYENDLKTKYENAYLFIAKNQQDDGGILNQNETMQNRVWASAYTIPAILEKPWTQIMSSFEKELQQELSITQNQTETFFEKEKTGEVLGEGVFKFSQSMKLGTRSSEVVELQKRLSQEGFLEKHITGYFGFLTRNAVRDYQKVNPPLKIDGVVGPLTIKMLNGEN